MARLVASLLTIILLVPSSMAASSEPVVVERLWGPDRTATSVAVARTVTRGGQPYIAEVIVASAADYPDGLVGGSFGRPLLLTPTGGLPAAVRDLLEEGRDARPPGTRATVLGGTDVISDAVVDELAALGYRVERVAGSDRYSTAARAAHRTCSSVCEQVVITTGEAFPDALVAGSLEAGPVLLTRRDELPQATIDALGVLDPERVLIVGGPQAVANSVPDRLRDRGITVRRVYGKDRLATAVAVARERLADHESHDNAVLLARGDDFPDGLSAAGHAITWNVPVLLTASPHMLGAPTSEFLEEIANCGLDVRVLGGSSAVTDRALAAAQAAATPAGGCTAESRQGPELLYASQEPTQRADRSTLVLEWDEPVRCGDDEVMESAFDVLRADGSTAWAADDWWDCNHSPDQPDSTMRIEYDGDLVGGTVTYREVTRPDAVVFDLDRNRAEPRVQEVGITD